MNQETKRDLWMAKKLHTCAKESVLCPNVIKVWEIGGDALDERIFSLTNNAEDREAALIWLGDCCGISIEPYQHGGWVPVHGEHSSYIGSAGTTHQQAILEAIDYLREQEVSDE